MRHLAWIALPLLLAGCGQSPTSGTPAVGSSPAVPAKAVTSITGPGGDVAIGDSLDQAKKAFPPPAGSQVYETSLSFAILGKQGWAWSSTDNMQAFEVALADGKVVAMARTSSDPAGEPAKTFAAIGSPTKKAVGKASEMFVWEAGDQARFWLRIKAGTFMPIGFITLIGSKEDLKLLNYRADDPETFVKQMDSSADLAESPAVKKAFEEAKRRALDKRKGR